MVTVMNLRTLFSTTSSLRNIRSNNAVLLSNSCSQNFTGLVSSISRQLSNLASTPLSPSRPMVSRLRYQYTCTSMLPRIRRRWLFIQTENTPNVNALKFKPNQRILPESLPVSFLEYLSPRATLAPPYPSPLASQLLSVDGVSSVFYGADYITVTKDGSAQWTHVKPEVFSLITEVISSGQPVVNDITSGSVENAYEEGAAKGSEDYDQKDAEVVAMIKELLETRVRPAIQEDGGDIEFKGFKDNKVLLKLRGACRTCDSSTITLRNGIENMLQFYIPEVQGIHQVLDQEEEIALKEFAKFEEKLRLQKA